MIDGKKLNQEEQIRAYAEIYARNLIMYGVDVREKLETATQMSFALNQAYMRGKQDECHRRWIPCSERLPEEEGKVLLTINLEGKKVIELGEHLGKLEWCIYDEYYSCTYAKWEVIAWMPLPPAYKEK